MPDKKLKKKNGLIGKLLVQFGSECPSDNSEPARGKPRRGKNKLLARQGSGCPAVLRDNPEPARGIRRPICRAVLDVVMAGVLLLPLNN